MNDREERKNIQKMSKKSKNIETFITALIINSIRYAKHIRSKNTSFFFI